MNTPNLTRNQKIVLVAATATLLLFLAARTINSLAARDLVLDITPSGATVKIDNEVQPGTSFNLNATSHDVNVTKEGYLPKNTIVTISKGKKTTLTINLVKKTPGTVSEYVFRETIYPNYPKQELKVLSAKQLYDSTWIVSTLLIGGEEERVIVLQKDTSDTGYKLYLTGPPFNLDAVTTLPVEVQTLITDTTRAGGEL